MNIYMNYRFFQDTRPGERRASANQTEVLHVWFGKVVLHELFWLHDLLCEVVWRESICKVELHDFFARWCCTCALQGGVARFFLQGGVARLFCELVLHGFFASWCCTVFLQGGVALVF